MINRLFKIYISCFVLGTILCLSIHAKDNMLFGVYYFDGWSGHRKNSNYHFNAPTHLTNKLCSDYTEREPLWGWRDDSIEIMEHQIDIASKNGIDFFIFCWYWRDDEKAINIESIIKDPLHTSLNLFMNAKNREKIKYCILIANHSGARVNGGVNWVNCIKYLSDTYFKDPQYLKLDGKPVVEFFIPEQATSSLTQMENCAYKEGFPGLFTIASRINNKNFSASSWYNTFEAGDSYQECKASELIEYTEGTWQKNSHPIVIPTCMAGWDKRPWYEIENFKIYKRPSAKEFNTHLKHACEFVNKREQKEKIIQIYAWNEYGEGGYLAPTKGDKKGRLLKQIKSVKRKFR